jgi:predicted esterase
MEAHYIPVTKTARIFSVGDVSQAKEILFVVHGYGQLANYFIRHFEDLHQEKNICVVAPEGLSRFYIKGYFGQVGATWMTKEDREIEIADQKAYLEQIYAHFLAQNPTANYHLLGFSQGVATTWRWLTNGYSRFESVTFWAGECPQEFSEEILKKLQDTKMFHVHANQDEFIPSDAAIRQAEALKAYFPQLKSLSFEGKHNLNTEILREIFS